MSLGEFGFKSGESAFDSAKSMLESLESGGESHESRLESKGDSAESMGESIESAHESKSDSPFPRLDSLPQSLLALKNPPKNLFYKGDLSLLDSFKVAIVGTRAPNPYTKSLTAELSAAIAKYAVVVSGGALGVDIIAHTHAFPRTIMIAPSSLDIIYPRENAKMIEKIAHNALILSEYERDYMPHKYSFLERNRLVVGLSDIVILPQGDLKSGTSSSARFAVALKKPIFTLPHRYNESTLTNALLASGEAKAIYNIDDFVEKYIVPNACRHCENREAIHHLSSLRDEPTARRGNPKNNIESDEILTFCAKRPSFEDAFAKFGNKILEYEFSGLLVRENNTIRLK